MLEMPENLAINNGGGDDSPKFRKKVYQVRSSSISTFKQDKQHAEEIYRLLFDKKKQISEQGQKICNQHGIDAESLVPLKLEYFESQDGDKDMARLHYRHY